MTESAVEKPDPIELDQAVMGNDVEAVKELLRRDVHINARNMRVAVRNGYTEIVRLLIEKGADVNIQAFDKSTPLMEAVFICNIEITRLLINGGAEITISNNAGETAISLAERKGRPEMIHLLKEALEVHHQLEVRAAIAQKQQRLNAARQPLVLRRPQP